MNTTFYVFFDQKHLTAELVVLNLLFSKTEGKFVDKTNKIFRSVIKFCLLKWQNEFTNCFMFHSLNQTHKNIWRELIVVHCEIFYTTILIYYVTLKGEFRKLNSEKFLSKYYLVLKGTFFISNTINASKNSLN